MEVCRNKAGALSKGKYDLLGFLAEAAGAREMAGIRPEKS
jgi:hypothetical protein